MGQDIWALRLFVDLYYDQNLRDDGGIDRQLLWQEYERKAVGQHGFFTVWAFKPGKLFLCPKGPFEVHWQRKEGEDNPLWESVRSLETHGLISFVPHLWESASDQAEILHPYGIAGVGREPIETELGMEARQAVLAMSPEFRTKQAWEEGFYYFAPVKTSIPDVQMIGVARLRYRPRTRTRRTSTWYGELFANAPTWITMYRELREKIESAKAGT